MERSRSFALVRGALWWNCVRLRMEHADNFVARGKAGIVSYVLGRREPKADAYVVDEFAYEDGEESACSALLRGAAGDLRRVTGWLPPLPARRLLPRGSVRTRSSGVLMMAPLSRAGAQFIEAAQERSGGDPVWITDHV